jgi:hypothetical protein
MGIDAHCEMIQLGAFTSDSQIPGMIKKRSDGPAPAEGQRRVAQDELLAYAINLLGSEERARAMLAAGTLRLLVPRERQAPDSPQKLCGALARSTGKPCQAPGNGRGGRCKLHGGMSTGPRTEQGRRRLQEAMKERWVRKRNEQA